MRTDIHLGGAFRTLWSWERDEYAAHLKRLEPHCRRLRFHRAMTDDALERHAAQAFEAGSHVIGWFVDGELAGAAEVAVYRGAAGLDAEAAFAVESPYRHGGVGSELMHRAALFARNRGAETLHVATETENTAMLRLAERSGATFEIYDTEVDGVLHQNPRTVHSMLLETLEEDAGVIRWMWDAGWRAVRRGWRAAAAPLRA